MQDGRIWDDTRGGWLNPVLAAAARAEEMEYIRRHRVYHRVPRSEALRDSGRQPIKTGWVDTNKGSPEKPLIRSRWVANKFNTGSRFDLFALATPLEGIRLVIWESASMQRRDAVLAVIDIRLVISESATMQRRDVVLAVIDVRRAYFFSLSKRKIFVELPGEDYQRSDESLCGQ